MKGQGIQPPRRRPEERSETHASLSPIRRALRATATGSVVLVVSACRLQGDCVSIGRPSHTLTLRDSVSGQVVSAGARVVVVAGTAVDTVFLPDNREGAIVAMERDEPVSLLVSQVGYREWRRDNLTATREQHCNVIRTLHVTARLQRSP